jgi:23S rRNA pseudouridine1911/1915/1917 synthase
MCMEVLWSDAHFLAVNKPSGIPAQPDRTGDASVIELLQKEPVPGLAAEQLGSPHRLDRPVSGVLLLTRTAEALASANMLFARHAFSKTYWAMVHGTPPAQGEWHHDLVHLERSRKALLARPGQNATACKLSFKLLAQGERYALMELEPDRGAFHQIRAQCAAAGHAIKGDVKYGARRGEPDRSIALHARSLSFVHPFTGQPVRVEAPAPSTPLWEALLNMWSQGNVAVPR